NLNYFDRKALVTTTEQPPSLGFAQPCPRILVPLLIRSPRSGARAPVPRGDAMDYRGNFIAQNVRLTALSGCARVLSASIALWLLVLSSASAATDIQGTPDDLRLNVSDATLVEVLNALSSRFNVSYKLHSHNSRVLTGQYSGTLRATLTRILDGNDYFLEISDKRLEIIVLVA